MTYFCCTYTDSAKTRISRFVRNEDEFRKICGDVKRQGYTPIKTKVTVSEDFTRTETAIK